MKDPGPAISYITPTGGTGDLVQIQGYDFGSSRGSSAVLFGSVPATSYVSWDNQHVLVRVPAGVSGTVEGRVGIAARNVVWGSPENLRCDLDITGRATGQWDVVVANPDGQSSLLAGGFTIENPPPAVSSITPASGTRGSIVEVGDLSGSNCGRGVSALLGR